MRISRRFIIACGADQVLSELRSPLALARCVPGLESFHQREDGDYQGRLAVSVAFVSLKFDVTLHMLDAPGGDPIRAEIEGKPIMLAGKLHADVEISATPEGQASSLVEYVMEVALTGKLGSMGQSAFRSLAEESGQQFARNLATLLTGTEATLL